MPFIPVAFYFVEVFGFGYDVSCYDDDFGCFVIDGIASGGKVVFNVDWSSVDGRSEGEKSCCESGDLHLDEIRTARSHLYILVLAIRSIAQETDVRSITNVPILRIVSGQIDHNSVIVEVVDECFSSADNVFQMEPNRAV
jgi:hypothetical protein